MRLYTCRGAPHAARVQLYVAEKAASGIDIPLEPLEVDLRAGEHRMPAHLARNRAGTVPVLEIQPGVYLTESLAIVEYLEECFPHPPMWGVTPLSRARQRELDRIAELRVLRPIAQWVNATNSPLGQDPDPGAAKGYEKAAASGISQIDAALQDGQDYLGGDSCGIADCTLAAGLDFGLKRGFALPDGASALNDWIRRFWSRRSSSEHLRWTPTP
ncbi:glutathione S-transferase family protein [Ramlibacter sp. MMS24-I3-19]|uniref:glutathione S-transferase family protein n=1 Tax=Ramlibacter sp. MMS24-I3-19 TaxID=3416606 RepID=UPI003D08A045